MGIEYLILLLVGQIAQGQEECNKLQNSPRPRTRTKSHLQETVCPMFYFIQVETCHPTLKCLVPQAIYDLLQALLHTSANKGQAYKICRTVWVL